MRAGPVYIFSYVLVLLLAGLGSFFGQGGWVVCQESNGRLSLESSHVPGGCVESRGMADGAAMSGDRGESCSDLPLSCSGMQLPQREVRVDLEHAAVVGVLGRVVACRPVVLKATSKESRIESRPPRLPVTDTIILLV